jgi:hypothetical protein
MSLSRTRGITKKSTLLDILSYANGKEPHQETFTREGCDNEIHLANAAPACWLDAVCSACSAQVEGIRVTSTRPGTAASEEGGGRERGCNNHGPAAAPSVARLAASAGDRRRISQPPNRIFILPIKSVRIQDAVLRDHPLVGHHHGHRVRGHAGHRLLHG